MNTTHVRSAAQDFRGLDACESRDLEHPEREPTPARIVALPAAFRAQRASALTGRMPWREEHAREYERSDDTPHIKLERATKTFRFLRARALRRSAARARHALTQVRDLYQRWVSVGVNDFDAMTAQTRELEGRAKWYAQRADAQEPRFDTVRACRTRAIHVACRVCETSLCDPIPCTCGVVRVCGACADAVAKKRQGRIANARVAAILDGHDAGLFFRKRRGGAFSEKMLTLTVPHIRVEDARGELRKACTGMFYVSHVNARIAALRLAWPKFLRSVKRWLKRNDPAGARHFNYYRLFEWTRASDGFGHPHFHVYLFSPWLDVALCRQWWAKALDAIGCPVPLRDGEPHVMIDLKRLAGFNWNALRELVKSGDRRAIETTLGTLRAPGLDAVEYAAAWTMADAFAELPPESVDATIDVQRDLYVANEGKRLAQGSRGFLSPPPIPVCECCGASMFVACVAYGFEACAAPSDRPGAPRETRGPPHGESERLEKEEAGIAVGVRGDA